MHPVSKLSRVNLASCLRSSSDLFFGRWAWDSSPSSSSLTDICEERKWPPQTGGERSKQTGSWLARRCCLSSRGFDSNSARLSENRRRGRDEASPQILMSALNDENTLSNAPHLSQSCPPSGACLLCRKKAWMTLDGVFQGSEVPQLLSAGGQLLHLLMSSWVLSQMHYGRIIITDASMLKQHLHFSIF